jgi:hypothetical protein
MYGDGHVEWQPTCFCGPVFTLGASLSRDNIYTSHNATKATNGNTKKPYDRQDSILCPTFWGGV